MSWQSESPEAEEVEKSYLSIFSESYKLNLEIFQVVGATVMAVVEAAGSLTLASVTIGRAVAALVDLAADFHTKEKIEVV